MPPLNVHWQIKRPEEGFYNSEVQAPGPMPVRTFLPTGYEPNYPYPLVVFFHAQGGNEHQVLHLAPRLSRRNFISIGLRGPHAIRTTGACELKYSWGGDGRLDSRVEDYVLHAIEQTRRTYHVHSERIFLAGICEGARMAYQLALTFPRRFAGVISLNGAMPRRGGPLLRLPEARALRVFIGHGLANAYIPFAAARQDHQLLWSAGLNVAFHSYPATHRLHPDMLRDVNRWIMDAVNAD